MVSKGDHPQMALRFRLVNYYNLPRFIKPNIRTYYKAIAGHIKMYNIRPFKTISGRILRTVWRDFRWHDLKKALHIHTWTLSVTQGTWDICEREVLRWKTDSPVVPGLRSFFAFGTSHHISYSNHLKSQHSSNDVKSLFLLSLIIIFPS